LRSKNRGAGQRQEVGKSGERAEVWKDKDKKVCGAKYKKVKRK
jgi:hypothetical protein